MAIEPPGAIQHVQLLGHRAGLDFLKRYYGVVKWTVRRGEDVGGTYGVENAAIFTSRCYLIKEDAAILNSAASCRG
jgi:hypothetical protein